MAKRTHKADESDEPIKDVHEGEYGQPMESEFGLNESELAKGAPADSADA